MDEDSYWGTKRYLSQDLWIEEVGLAVTAESGW